MVIKEQCVGAEVALSDAFPLAGLPDGEYEWEHGLVFVWDGPCCLADGSITGPVMV
jgi:N-acetylglucosamine-6-phosphate deacetylase